MVIDKIFVAHATMLSLSDRFTIIQSVRPPAPTWRPQTRLSPTPSLTPPRPAALRRRRSQARMGMTPHVQATLRKKIPVKQRIGKIRNGTSQWQPKIIGNALTYRTKRNGFYVRHTPRVRPVRKQQPLSRANSYGNLSAANSYENLSQVDGQRNGNYRRGRGNRNRGVLRNQSGGRGNGGMGLQGGGGWASRGRRGMRGPRGRGRGPQGGLNRNSYNQKTEVPTKEELDSQLDQYMSGSRATLDKELDTYMSHAMDFE